MIFVNSTDLPADYQPNLLTWNIIDLKPGQVKTIDYIARALQGGLFVNSAHIDAFTVNGSDIASADVSCQVGVGGEFNSSYSSSTWQPPKCFGLNYTEGAATEMTG